MKNKKYWIILNPKGKPFLNNAQLPIYWYKKTAIKVRDRLTDHTYRIVPVTINLNP